MIVFCKIILTLVTFSAQASLALNWKDQKLISFTKEKLNLSAPFLEKYTITSFKEFGDNFELSSKKQSSVLVMEIHKTTKNRDEFDNFKRSNLMIVKNLYRQNPSPYPGSISKNQECREKKFKPLEYEVTNKDITFFVLEGDASNRLGFGGCDLDHAAPYRGAIVIFKTNSYYCLIRMFVPYRDFIKNKFFYRKVVRSLVHFKL